jgi:hypothetical protein
MSRVYAYRGYVLALIRPGAAGGRVGHVSPTAKQQSGRRTTMYAQLTYFDGPRTPEQVAADDFGARTRTQPAISKLGHHFRVFVLRRDDGSQVVVSIADTKQALLDAQKAIMSTELLPGEDPALLTGPDRIDLYPVLEAHDINNGTGTGS